MKCPLCTSEESQSLPRTREGRLYLKCATCDFVWLSPVFRVSEREEEDRYLEHHNSPDIPAYRAYLSRLAQPVLRHVNRGALGLDYGCGPVEGMKALLEPDGYEVISYDPYFFPRFPEGPFDFVLCSEAAEHFYAPAEEFARIDAILKPKGVLGVSSWLLPPPEKFEDWSYRRDKTHVGFFGEKSVRWLARARGWEILALESPLWILRKG
jgi:hypothetical protein